MLDLYNSQVSALRTINHVNQLHISYANTITPMEVIALEDRLFRPGKHAMPQLHPEAAFSSDELKKAGREWIDAIWRDFRRIGKAKAEHFVRRDLRESVTLFTDGGAPAEKSLLVVLPGANFRVMMPIPTFLQNLDAATTDVLIIRDGTRSGYLQGLAGLAPAIEELGPALDQLLDLGTYKRLVGLGVSAGGLPILMVARQMDFAAVLTCGAGSPLHPRWEGRGRPSPAETLRASNGRARVTVAFGANHDIDRQDAKDIADCLEVNLVEVSFPDQEVKHNMLYPLSNRALLPGFLKEHLGI